MNAAVSNSSVLTINEPVSNTFSLILTSQISGVIGFLEDGDL